MWEFIKTSVSVLGLFIILILLVGFYSSLVENNPEGVEPEINYETAPDSSTTTEPMEESSSPDGQSSEGVLEDMPTF